MINCNNIIDQNDILQFEKNKQEILKDYISLDQFKFNINKSECNLFKNTFRSSLSIYRKTNKISTTLTDKDKDGETQTKETLTKESLSEKKEKKKAGRKSLDSFHKTINDIKLNSNVHSKKTKDNVRRKVKVKFTHFLISFLNRLIRLNWKGFQKYKFRTIDNKITKDISIATNRQMFTTTVGEYLTYPVSSKFKCDINQNKKIASKIMKEKPQVFQNILDMKMVDFYNTIYRGDSKKIRETMKLNEDLPEKSKNKLLFFVEFLFTLTHEVDYLMIYNEVGTHFFDFYQEQKGRKPRSKKKLEDYNETKRNNYN